MQSTDSKANGGSSPGAALRLLLPSDGALYQGALDFMRDCGLNVLRASARSYSGQVPSLDGAEVLFQRSSDITEKVEEGSADFGITGLDRYLEYRNDEQRVVPLIDDLHFGRCELVLAVPSFWLDVTSVADLADLALEFRQAGKQLRIANKYPRLLRRYLFDRGINYFTLVPASGSLEAAPAAGYADLIADITATGATLRENRLKPLEEGTILASQACLIGNTAALTRNPDTLQVARSMLELMEAHLQAGPFYRLTANVRGASAAEVSTAILARPDVSGLRGPTVARVYNIQEQDWHSVSLLVKKEKLLEAVDHLRDCGAVDIASYRVSYLFDGHSQAYHNLFDGGPEP